MLLDVHKALLVYAVTRTAVAAVEDGGVPRGALPPPVLFQNGLPAGRGLLGRRPSLSRMDLGKADRLWMGSDHLLMYV